MTLLYPDYRATNLDPAYRIYWRGICHRRAQGEPASLLPRWLWIARRFIPVQLARTLLYDCHARMDFDLLIVGADVRLALLGACAAARLYGHRVLLYPGMPDEQVLPSTARELITRRLTMESPQLSLLCSDLADFPVKRDESLVDALLREALRINDATGRGEIALLREAEMTSDARLASDRDGALQLFFEQRKAAHDSTGDYHPDAVNFGPCAQEWERAFSFIPEIQVDHTHLQSALPGLRRGGYKQLVLGATRVMITTPTPSFFPNSLHCKTITVGESHKPVGAFRRFTTTHRLIDYISALSVFDTRNNLEALYNELQQECKSDAVP